MAKILLVEDNEMNRDTLSRRLVRRGDEVVVDGHVGVVMAGSERPALTLMRRARRQTGSCCGVRNEVPCRSQGEKDQ